MMSMLRIYHEILRTWNDFESDPVLFSISSQLLKSGAFCPFFFFFFGEGRLNHCDFLLVTLGRWVGMSVKGDFSELFVLNESGESLNFTLPPPLLTNSSRRLVFAWRSTS